MRFILGATKLTGLIATENEKYAQNSCLWSPTTDIKQAWGRLYLDSTGLDLLAGDGIADVSRDASGIGTIDYTTTFDAPPCVFFSIIISSGVAASRRYVIAEDGTNYERSTTQQSFYVLNAACTGIINDGTESATINFWAFGVDSATTPFTNNSATKFIREQDLNRMIAIGDYENPESIEDTIPILSCGYTGDDGGEDGDTLTNISNMTNHSRDGEGDYSTDFTNNYMLPPMGALIQILGDAGTQLGGYGFGTATIETLTVGTTSGANITPLDRNYCFAVMGLIGVS